jgi:DNA segregation ATPase FtsK/SpoIIIE-like protein
VSNPRRETVFIKEVLQSDGYKNGESKLTLALGKDTTGNVAVADLGRMPHLLIAGATGTGKSVSMNAMIMSILFKTSPRDTRMIMIDPKMLELSTYEGIPHLPGARRDGPEEGRRALANMVREMEDRYRLLHEKGVRNVDSYNRLIAQAAKPPAPKSRGRRRGRPRRTWPWRRATMRRARAAASIATCRGIVVIIDELADLMMTVGREIEESITRLAQKARAAGIHLILATQRPSVDVITGLIKANFPARISFQVTSGTNSRTILDCVGAERLLGEGDMLFLPPGRRACSACTARSCRTPTSTRSSTSSSARSSRATRWSSSRAATTTTRRRPRRGDCPTRCTTWPCARDRAPPGVDLVAPAPPPRRLQPRGAHDRADGARGCRVRPRRARRAAKSSRGSTSDDRIA